MESLNQWITNSLITESVTELSLFTFIICIMTSLVIGVFIAVAYMYQARYTKGFVVTVALLPAIVCMVIMMVNGNIGTGVAVAGTFSLVRFRSVPGTAKEIGTIFLAMGAGLAMGIGFVGYGIIFTVAVCIVSLLLQISKFGETKVTVRTLIITMPEELDYTCVFDDLFEKYTTVNQQIRVKSINMGSLFKVTYEIELKSEKIEKEFLDDLRCRNGNLEIVMSKQSNCVNEL